MAESYYPAHTFPPKPDRVGDRSIKVTTQSPKLGSKVRRNFKSNGAAPRKDRKFV